MSLDRDQFGRFKEGFIPSVEHRRKLSEAMKAVRAGNGKRDVVCEICGQTFKVFPYRQNIAKYCSRQCKNKGVGKAISAGKITGIPRLSTQGYWFLFMPSYHRANEQGYAKMADVIFEKFHRPLQPREVVHHKDECRTNDHPDNLEAFTNAEHGRMHAEQRDSLL